jgi:hypothetical protein
LDDVTLTGTLAAVPEPHEYGIAIMGLLGVVIFNRRKASRVCGIKSSWKLERTHALSPSLLS